LANSIGHELLPGIKALGEAIGTGLSHQLLKLDSGKELQDLAKHVT
jgi:hypothetical protein